MTSRLGSLLGAARPRVELRPADIAYSLGPEASELAARAGLPPEDWQADGLDLMLSVREDGRWAAREYAEILGRQQGKSAGLGVPRALTGLLLLGERLIMWSAHEYKTAMESFLTCRDALAALGERTGPNTIVVDGITIRVNNTNGEEGFALSTGQRLRFIARSKGSGRGFSGDCNIIDESFAYTRAQQSALAPTMLARPNPQTIYLSSPPLDDESGEVLFRLKRRAEAGDARLGWRDWGLDVLLEKVQRMGLLERRAFLDDRANWSAALPALGRGRVDEEAVDQLRREMDDLDFAREVLCLWPRQRAAGGGVIADAVWAALTDETSTIVGVPAFAIDANPERSAASIAAAGLRSDGLVHGEAIEHRTGLAWVVDRAVELNERHGPQEWLLDPDGPAGALLPELRDAGIEPHLISGREFAQSCVSFYDTVHAPGADQLRHNGDPVLAAAVSAGRKRDVGDGLWRWRRRGTEEDISPLVAVTLAVWGVTAYAVREPPAPVAVESGSSARLETADLSRIGF